MLVELKNGETYNGHLVNCDTWMNIHLRDVICTSKDGDRFWRMPECYIHGNAIKYLRVPDENLQYCCHLWFVWLIWFIGNSVISGFTTASSFVIGLLQAKSLLGYDVSRSSQIIPLVKSIMEGADKLSWPPFIMWSSIVALILVMKLLGKTRKGLRFLRAGWLLTVVVLGIAFVKIFHPSSISLVEDITQGLPSFSILKEFGQFKSLIPTAMLITGVAILRGKFVAGLREEIVNSADQVLKLIEMGEVNRHFGETNMNVRSSRSHTIFRMVIESKGKDSSSNLDDAIRVSVLGTKQRGHIPYRDSKLTRILQPALGGNAKTSIICTVAPEEIHIEETKRTLQFVSRAKRITNCVQVNEGSHAGVLEQEILKLRNDMLKYELEHEKVAMELEEERKLHREQMKNGSANTLSGSNVISAHGGESLRHNLKEETSDSCSIQQGDAFSTPTFKPIPNAFVAKRSNYSTTPIYIPLPDEFGDVADEDTWFKMNNGFIADLDSIRMTPPKQLSSIPSFDKIEASLSV
ncbi:hypothetical protein L2E82_05205 [Cichorium intybus]|uniref:Uncharacterized protein n=1 Tax=Cichorium intybus TaxID=13427 RepID=A0ACB9H7E6_CICIN|nr:hypothetical protein L2E82_05205 [Cichorium intybus]